LKNELLEIFDYIALDKATFPGVLIQVLKLAFVSFIMLPDLVGALRQQD
jgi:hypothetical protein